MLFYVTRNIFEYVFIFEFRFGKCLPAFQTFLNTFLKFFKNILNIPFVIFKFIFIET